MSLTSSTTFDVADQAPQTASTSLVIQAAVGVGVGKGRLVHPDLGTYDYPYEPTETVDIDGGPLYGPTWAHAVTLGGGADAMWSGKLRDARVIERWKMGDVGMPIDFLRTLWQFFANAPDPADGFVIWAPNYCTAQQYKVAIVGVRAGGSGITLDRRLLKTGDGWAPQPVEVEMRVIALAP